MFCSRPGWSRPRPMVASGDYPEGFLELGNRGPAGKSGTQENHLVREERDRAGRGSGPSARSPSKKSSLRAVFVTILALPQDGVAVMVLYDTRHNGLAHS